MTGEATGSGTLTPWPPLPPALTPTRERGEEDPEDTGGEARGRAAGSPLPGDGCAMGEGLGVRGRPADRRTIAGPITELAGAEGAAGVTGAPPPLPSPASRERESGAACRRRGMAGVLEEAGLAAERLTIAGPTNVVEAGEDAGAAPGPSAAG